MCEECRTRAPERQALNVLCTPKPLFGRLNTESLHRLQVLLPEIAPGVFSPPLSHSTPREGWRERKRAREREAEAQKEKDGRRQHERQQERGRRATKETKRERAPASTDRTRSCSPGIVGEEKRQIVNTEEPCAFV